MSNESSESTVFLVTGYFQWIKKSFGFSKTKFFLLLVPILLWFPVCLFLSAFYYIILYIIRLFLLIAFLWIYITATSKEAEELALSVFKKEWDSLS